MRYCEEKKYIGNRDQLLTVKRYELQEGKAKGVEVIDVQNHSGMHFQVNLSRGMDIHYLDFCGENIGFLSPCGTVAPQYFDDKEIGFLKNFTAGFMTTCGLEMIGSPCEYQGKHHGLHGNVSNIPAEEVSYTIDESQEEPSVCIRGKMREAVLFGTKLSLERQITCKYKERKIVVRDKVTNEGYEKACNMMLYHCNIGYPILTPSSELFMPTVEMKGRNPQSQADIANWQKITEPVTGYDELCYYHKLKKDADNHSAAAIYNPDLDLGICVEFEATSLDRMLQWKMLGAGEYVVGLEPANASIDGMEDAIENGSMKYLEAGESREYELTFRVLKGKEEFEQLKGRFA